MSEILLLEEQEKLLTQNTLFRLLQKNFKVATLSRGYKRKTRDFRIASSESLVKEIGDEPMQILRKFPDVLVTVDGNRVNGVKVF